MAFTANDVESVRRGAAECSDFIAQHPEDLDDIAYTLGRRREHLSYRSFAVVDNENVKDVTFSAPVKTPAAVPSIAFIFTGQGAQWPAMGATLLADYQSAGRDLQIMEKALSGLDQELAPSWSLSGMKIHLSLTFTGDSFT